MEPTNERTGVNLLVALFGIHLRHLVGIRAFFLPSVKSTCGGHTMLILLNLLQSEWSYLLVMTNYNVIIILLSIKISTNYSLSFTIIIYNYIECCNRVREQYAQSRPLHASLSHNHDNIYIAADPAPEDVDHAVHVCQCTVNPRYLLS